MEPLRHIVEPEGLLLTWQPADEGAQARSRRIVAQISRTGDGDELAFHYLKGDEDFRLAQAAGFQGFPTFNLRADEVHTGVLDALLRRLPPRHRADFDRYLAQHFLPSPFEHSNLALLGYTGARLPSDGFGLVPTFAADYRGPCDFLIEVAGLRWAFAGDVSSLREGDPVQFSSDPMNEHDPHAIQIHWRGQVLGYVSRVLRGPFTEWLLGRPTVATVARINGKPTRPLVYIAVRIPPAVSSTV